MKPIEHFTFYFEDKFTAKFFKDYMEFIFKTNLATWGNNQTYYITKGFGGVKQKVNELEKSTGDGKQNLVFVDADKNFKEREDFLIKFKAEAKVQFDYFIFPNAKATGEIEDVIYEVAIKTELKDCFSKYEECIKNAAPYQPDIKGKLYAYHQAFVEPKYRKNLMTDEEREYKSELYNLDSKELEPLKNFLQKHLA